MSVLFQMPTGTGKTTVFSEIVRKAHDKQKKVLVVVHRIELVEQIADRLRQFKVDAGIISAGFKSTMDFNIKVATIQTLTRRKYPPADLIIIDECHHAKARTYKKLWEIYPKARFLGVTATPVRINGEGFEDLFDILIPLGKLSYFFDEGYLAKIKHLVCTIPDLTNVRKRVGDYDTGMLKRVMLNNGIMASLVESYMKYAKGKKTIVFAVDVEHSMSIVERYNYAGIPAAHVDAKTPKQERKVILERFRNGEILILSNVDIVSEGFDVPDCEAVQLARPTKSLVLYLQQVGRCMRPAPNKNFGLVLDNAGLWVDHGLSYIDREWTLKGNKKAVKGKKKEESISRKSGVYTIGDKGEIKEIKKPQEAAGLELRELTQETERLLTFEHFLTEAIAKEHKPSRPLYRYFEHLVNKKAELSDLEVRYISKRMADLGHPYKQGFFYYRAKEIREDIKQNKKYPEYNPRKPFQKKGGSFRFS